MLGLLAAVKRARNRPIFNEFSAISARLRPCFLLFGSIEFASRGLLWQAVTFLLFGGYKYRSHKACQAQ
jgi:hypothetical protein